MNAYTFVESMQQETIHILPVIVIPLMILFIYVVLECLSSRSRAKEIENRKYTRNLMISAVPTKVELERINERSCRMNDY